MNARRIGAGTMAAVTLVTSMALGHGDATAREPGHNLVTIEFVEYPPTGLVVSGGLLGVPDSSGAFPDPYRRFDPATGNRADPGRAVGDALVFTNLRPGTYRLAMVFLEESKFASRVLPKHGTRLADRCPVYGDSIPELTFSVGEGEFRYLGRVTRRSNPTLEGGSDGLWNTRLEWSHGDEVKVVRSMSKRKSLAAWRPLIAARLATLERGGGAPRSPKR